MPARHAGEHFHAAELLWCKLMPQGTQQNDLDSNELYRTIARMQAASEADLLQAPVVLSSCTTRKATPYQALLASPAMNLPVSGILSS